MAVERGQLSAAYGRFYLENRPVLLREAELAGPTTDAPERLTREWGVHGIRRADEGAAAPADAPFGLSRRAAWASARATDDRPARLGGVPPTPGAVASAIARGVRGYGLRLDAAALRNGPPSDLVRLHEWLAGVEDELTSSVEVRDGLAFLEYPPYADVPEIEGGFGVLVSAGYNPTLVDLEAATDADLAEFPAAVFPSRGYADLDTYGKLVVLTLRGATLVTYPEPVRRLPDGTPFRTTFLWPESTRRASARRPGERQLGRRFQIRDGVSTILTEPLGEPYGGSAYARLPASQRRAHRQLVLSLLHEAAPRAIVPDDDLEVEAVARLSPEGGALLFLVSRLGPQEGHVGFPAPETLSLGQPLLVETLFSSAESTAERDGDGIRVRMGREGVLILRLG